MALGLPQMRFDIFARDRSGPAWRGVENSIQRTQRSLAGFMRLAAPLLGVGSAAIGGTALAYMARDALEFADALVQAADRTSFAIEELEALRYAGRLNRVQFTQTDMAMQRFSRRLAEAAGGSGELANDLRELNIPLRDANGNMRSSYDILLDYADAVQNAESEQEQLRLAFRAFDSEGAAYVTVLRQGSEGLRAYRSEAEETGAIMGDQLAREASEAATALERMNLQITSERNRVIAENADELRSFAEALSEVVKVAIEAAAAVGSLYDRFNRSEGGRLALTPEDDEERGRLLEDARELRDRIGRRTAGTELGRRDYADLVGALGADAWEREGLSLGVRSDLSGRMIHRLVELLNRRIEELEGVNLPSAHVPIDTPQSPQSPTGLPAAGGLQYAPPKPDKVSERRVTATGHEDKEALETAQQEQAQLAISLAEELSDKMREAAGAIATRVKEDREEFARTFGDAMSGAAMALAEGRFPEYFADRLRQALYNRLFDLFTQLGSLIFDNATSNGKGDGGLIAAGVGVLSGRYGGKKAAGGPVEPGKFYQWQERGQEFFAPRVPGQVIPAGAPHHPPAVPIHQHFHLHAEGAVMTEELLDQMDAKANRAAATGSAQAQQQMAKRGRKSQMRF